MSKTHVIVGGVAILVLLPWSWAIPAIILVAAILVLAEVSRHLLGGKAAPIKTGPRGLLRCVIAGGGMSGLASAHRLREAGVRDIVILEKSEGGAGGVWRENRYPGVACDVGAHLYSFSFFQNPWWSRSFCPGGEILEYMKSFSKKAGIEEMIHRGLKVTKVSWDDERSLWSVEAEESGGRVLRVYEAEVFIQATGRLHVPSYGNLKNPGEFLGPVVHSAEWREEDLEGKETVAVVGTGASAVQLVPSLLLSSLGQSLSRLFVIQRNPAWVPKRNDFDIPQWAKTAMHMFPPLHTAYRYFLFWQTELLAFLLFDCGAPLSKVARMLMGRTMRETLGNSPDLERDLIPDFAVGCKRTTPSDSYLKAFLDPRVTLVRGAVSGLASEGVLVTRDEGEEERLVPSDAVVLATGFDLAATAAPFRVTGRGGVAMEDVFRPHPQAYLGVAVPGFPNYFLIGGPHAGVLRGSLLFMIECQVDFVLDCLRAAAEEERRVIEVTKKAADRFQSFLSSRFSRGGGLFLGCPPSLSPAKRGSVLRWALWPASKIRFWWMTRRCRREDFVFEG